jgi:para-aminobenzoate synthetase component 1
MRAKHESEPGARTLRRWELPCPQDPATLFDAMRALPWPVFLDSGACHGDGAEYSILAAAPRLTLCTWGPVTEIRRGRAVVYSAEDPFELLRRYLGPTPAEDFGLPFTGGAIGYWGYDLGRRLEHLPSLARPGEPLPDMALGMYDTALVIDHLRRRCFLVGAEDSQTGQAPLWELLRQRLRDTSRPRLRSAPFRTRAPLQVD